MSVGGADGVEGCDEARNTHAHMKPEGQSPADAGGVLAQAGAVLRSAPATALCALAVLLVYALCVGVWMVLRWRAGVAGWPGVSDTGLSRTAAIVGVAALVLALGFLGRTCRLRPDGGRTMRAGGILAGVLVLVALAACLWQCLTLARAGVVLWQPRATLFPAADIYYLHAVKIRLKQLQAGLERRRNAAAGDLTADEESRLALIGTLQSNLVGWTEQEVGRWLEDTAQRRSLLALTAFQIHAGSPSRGGMQQRAAQERAELARRRGWLTVLREHCVRRLAQHQARVGHAASHAAAADDAAQESADAVAADAVAAHESWARALRRELEQVGADAWSFALTVAHDAADATMAAEYLNQIDVSLKQLAARDAFVDEYLEPMWSVPPAPGLNQRYAWLRLPVQFPHARAWAAGFVLLTGVQAVLLLLALAWVCALPWRRGARTGVAPVAGAGVWTCAATAVACANFVLLYTV
ncbi:MAG: hypothetical protein MUF48_11565 [Pirellulaceae bacterium]|jgi:hypothetical protein|nr:hypothetical protein [Pirellulaceae bacterium]